MFVLRSLRGDWVSVDLLGKVQLSLVPKVSSEDRGDRRCGAVRRPLAIFPLPISLLVTARPPSGRGVRPSPALAPRRARRLLEPARDSL